MKLYQSLQKTKTFQQSAIYIYLLMLFKFLGKSD